MPRGRPRKSDAPAPKRAPNGATLGFEAQLFLGTRIQCARCHHHPFEKWSQQDYYGMAAFFARLGRKNYDRYSNGQNMEAIIVNRAGDVRNPKTGQVVLPHGLDGPELTIPAGEDPRQELADWMAEPGNPFFAPALVNRLWGHFFSRGIVEPIDDMRVTNPPTNKELIDALNGSVPLPLSSTDSDRSGVVQPQDLLRLIDLLNGAGAFEPWNGRSLP